MERGRTSSDRIVLEVIPGGAGRADAEREAAAKRDEIAWVTRARSGDVAAQEALFRRHVGPLRQRVLRLFGRDAEVDDVVQDAFMQAFIGIRRLTEPAAFPAWLSTIAVHLVNRRLRRRKLLRRLGFVRASDALETVGAAVSPWVSPAVAAEARAIYARLDDLPAEVRVAFLLKRLEGLTIPEIAAQMKLSERTVKRRIAYAETALADDVEMDVPAEGD